MDHCLLGEEGFHSEYKEKDLKFCRGPLKSGMVIVLLDFILRNSILFKK